MSTPPPVASSTPHIDIVDLLSKYGIPYVEDNRNSKDVFIIHSIVKLYRALTPSCNNPNRLAALLVEVTQSLLGSIWHPNPMALFPMPSDLKLWTGILQQLFTMAPGDEHEAANSLMQLFQFGLLYCHSVLDIGTRLQHLLCTVSDRVDGYRELLPASHRLRHPKPSSRIRSSQRRYFTRDSRDLRRSLLAQRHGLT